MNSIKSILFSMAIISGPIVMASELRGENPHKVSHMCGFKALRDLSDDAFDEELMRIDASGKETTSSTVTRRLLSLSANDTDTWGRLKTSSDKIGFRGTVHLSNGEQTWSYPHEYDCDFYKLQDLCNVCEDEREVKFPQDFLKLDTSIGELYPSRKGFQVWKVEEFEIVLWKTDDSAVSIFKQKKPLFFPKNTDYENIELECGCYNGPYVSINLKHEGEKRYKGWTMNFSLRNFKGDSLAPVLDDPWVLGSSTAGKAARGGGGASAGDKKAELKRLLQEAKALRGRALRK